MKAVSGKRFARILEQHGWELLRIQGSHHIYGRRGNIVKLAVPIQGKKTLKIGLQRYLMKQAGLTENDL